jgi:hypothetical protein
LSSAERIGGKGNDGRKMTVDRWSQHVISVIEGDEVRVGWPCGGIGPTASKENGYAQMEMKKKKRRMENGWGLELDFEGFRPNKQK